MVKYHFLAEFSGTKLPPKRVSAEYTGKGKNLILKIRYYKEGKRIFSFWNYQNSLICVDPTIKGINKVHIGEDKLKNPHVESADKKQERFDLNQLDLDYAVERLEELERWRSEAYREELREFYRSLDGYFTPHRLNQLSISDQGLEKKILEMKEHIAKLKKQDNNRYLSTAMRGLEKDIRETTQKIEQEIKDIDIKDQLIMIIGKKIFHSVQEIYCKSIDILSFVNSRINPEEHQDYWEKINEWKNL